MGANNHDNKNLKSSAQTLRNDSTKAEIRLWYEILSGKRLGGYGFSRQRPIGNYIADFLRKELKLMIEVDGYSHNLKTEEDAARDKYLTELGFTVLRFSATELLPDLPNVQRPLAVWIEESGNQIK